MPTRLFTVHLHLIATIPDRRGHHHERSIHRRLVLIAGSEAEARDAALTWFARTWEAPTGKVAFGSGRRDAVDVRLAPEAHALSVHEEPSDVVEVS